jgi:hypothetical protein
MGELHRDGDLRMFAHRRQDRLQRGLVGIAVEAETGRRDAADRFHMGRLDAEHRRAGQRQRIDMGKMPIIGIAIDRGVLAHRRHHDAVGKLEGAELDRGKQGAHGAF